MLKSLLFTGLLLASGLLAETVQVTPNGKAYHVAGKCIATKTKKGKAATTATVDRAAAEKRGLKACRVCYRAKRTGNSWAFEKGGK